MTLHYIEESSIDIDHDSIIAQIEYSPDSFETSSEADLERAPSQTSVSTFFLYNNVTFSSEHITLTYFFPYFVIFCFDL